MTDRILIAPSILAADLAHLQTEVDSIEPYADWIQVDVMDGHFVPNLSFGAPVAKHIRTSLPLDIHLMVTNPEERIEEFLDLHVGSISFHTEVMDFTDSKQALIAAIRDGGALAGIALNPETEVEAITDVITDVDIVLVMSVHPGFGGQEFIPETLQKIAQIRALSPTVIIQVDGGISVKNSADCIAAGANCLVAGSTIFATDDRQTMIESLRLPHAI